MVIHPSALPAGIGVQISTYRSVALIVIGLVHASPQCTGSSPRPAGGAAWCAGGPLTRASPSAKGNMPP
jgi:hypothetical protein